MPRPTTLRHHPIQVRRLRARPAGHHAPWYRHGDRRSGCMNIQACLAPAMPAHAAWSATRSGPDCDEPAVGLIWPGFAGKLSPIPVMRRPALQAAMAASRTPSIPAFALPGSRGPWMVRPWLARMTLRSSIPAHVRLGWLSVAPRDDCSHAWVAGDGAGTADLTGPPGPARRSTAERRRGLRRRSIFPRTP